MLTALLCDSHGPSRPLDYFFMRTTPISTGTVFDVTNKRDVYGPGASYNIFAGKDASRGLGKSSLKTEDAVPDYSTLPPEERKVLDDWHSFFMLVLLLVHVPTLIAICFCVGRGITL